MFIYTNLYITCNTLFFVLSAPIALEKLCYYSLGNSSQGVCYTTISIKCPHCLGEALLLQFRKFVPRCVILLLVLILSILSQVLHGPVIQLTP